VARGQPSSGVLDRRHVVSLSSTSGDVIEEFA